MAEMQEGRHNVCMLSFMFTFVYFVFAFLTACVRACLNSPLRTMCTVTTICDGGISEAPMCKLCLDTMAALQPLAAIYVKRAEECGTAANLQLAIDDVVSQVVGPLLRNLSSTAMSIKSDVSWSSRCFCASGHVR